MWNEIIHKSGCLNFTLVIHLLPAFFAVDCHVTDRMKFVFRQMMDWLKLVELESLQDKFEIDQSLRKYFLIQIPMILKSMMSSSEFQSVLGRLLMILVILVMAQIAALKLKNNWSFWTRRNSDAEFNKGVENKTLTIWWQYGVWCHTLFSLLLNVAQTFFLLSFAACTANA